MLCEAVPLPCHPAIRFSSRRNDVDRPKLLRGGSEPLLVSHEELELAHSDETKQKGRITPQLPSTITVGSYGIGVAVYWDQTPGQSAISGFVWERSALVRHAVLARSQGRYEYCGRPGLLNGNGEVQIKKNHIVPLSGDEPRLPNNVIAFRHEHHREAYVGASDDELKGLFLKTVLVGEKGLRVGDVVSGRSLCVLRKRPMYWSEPATHLGESACQRKAGNELF